MPYFEFPDALNVRSDLVEAYRKSWDILAAPGCWWSAQQKIAIAQECRNARTCEYCAERKSALSPYAVTGEHNSSTDLPIPAIDAIHRITTDATRLSQSWLAELAEQHISDGHYVELLGIVVAVISVDEFHRALGLELEPLPTPQANEEPSGYRPAGATLHGAWVPTVEPADLASSEADLYGGAQQTGNVISAMSLVPDSVRLLNLLGSAQYLSAQQVPDPSANGGRAISRVQIELLAGRVSAFNECFY